MLFRSGIRGAGEVDVLLAERTALVARHDVVGVQITVRLADALEQHAQAKPLPAEVEIETVRVAGDRAADDGLVVFVDRVAAVDVGITDVADLNRLLELRAVGVNPVGLLLRADDAEAFEGVDAAYLDGCSPLKTFLVIMCPNAKSSFLTVLDRKSVV